ncbi:hypothetical protein BCR34DRAFT_601026 [Clohesyomyces aquaticus]|uniref:Peptidase M12A domain-containing protein n=1 Tax=Clohesyomyces aquaticus TaxID=1231657 RepID=A0A1Y1ZNU1_9PLEO|nr:hypothetical protein BCR34DRAFT_601026 [Clohesyomyces aquaticus]
MAPRAYDTIKSIRKDATEFDLRLIFIESTNGMKTHVEDMAWNGPGGILFRPNSNTTATEIDPATYGSAENWGDLQGTKPWKRTSENTVLIRYCYMNAATRAELRHEFESALTLWKNALGTRKNRHALVFEVTHVQGDGSIMKAAKKASLVGHLLGMMHEHQRRDRDKYIIVNCKAIAGYDEAWRNVQDLPPNKRPTEDQLRNNMRTALMFGFYVAWDFAPGYGVRPDIKLNERGLYDVSSTMHYTSSVYAGIEDCYYGREVNKCPILFWKDPEDHTKGSAHLVMRENGGPFPISAMDVKWVKDNYLWEDPTPAPANPPPNPPPSLPSNFASN